MKRTAASLWLLRGLVLTVTLISNGCAELRSPPPSPARAPEVQPAGLEVTIPAPVDPTTLPARLLVTGLGPKNELRPGELRIRVTGAPAISAQASIGFIFEDSSHTAIGLSDYWKVDASDNSLVISAEKMQLLISRLPKHQVNVMLGLVADAGAYAFAANFKAVRARAITPA